MTNPFSTSTLKEKIKVSHQNQIGGPMGFLNEFAGELLRTPQQMMADGGQFFSDSFQSIGGVITETVTIVSGKGLDMNASINFQQEKAKLPKLVEAEELQRQTQFFRNTEQDLGKVAMETKLADSLEARREEVNAALGIRNVSYTDLVKEDLSLRIDAEVAYSKKLAEIDTERVKASRDNNVALATAKGKIDLNSVMEGGTGSGNINISSTGGAGVG